MPIIETNGLHMHVETYGEGGEPILLLHGALSDLLQNWRMILQPLSQHFRLIGVDMRGHGKTDNPSGVFTLEALRDDALGVLDALGIEQAHVLGCSLGGYVALALRDAHPQRVASLGLAGVKVGWEPADARERTTFFQPEVIAQTYPFWLPHMAKSHATHYGMDHWRTLVNQVRELLQTLPTEAATSWERLEAEHEQLGLFYALGDRDELVPLAEVLKVRERRSDAEVLVLPKAGHLFREYNPHVFVAAYKDFLRRHRLG